MLGAAMSLLCESCDVISSVCLIIVADRALALSELGVAVRAGLQRRVARRGD